MNKINISIELTDEFLRDVLCIAIEGGSNYWAAFHELRFHKGEHYTSYQSAEVHNRGDEEESQSVHIIGLPEIAQGIQRLIGRDFNSVESHAQCHVRYSADMLQAAVKNDAGNVDSDLADLVLQLACFGHIIYG